MLTSNLLRNLNTSYGKMSKLQDQIQSGKKITRPSDDPVVAVKGMAYRTQLDKIEQFKRNSNELTSWLDTTDEALGQVGDAMNRVKELVVQAANDTNTADDRAKIKAEIDQIREQLRDLGNTRVGEKSIFTGTNTLQPLYKDVTYYDPEAIKKHYEKLADPNATTGGPSTAQQAFLDKISTDGIEATLSALTPPIGKVSDRMLNTTFTNLNGDEVDPLKAVSYYEVEISNTALTPVPNDPTAIVGTVETDGPDGVATGNPNEYKITTTTVGDTETITEEKIVYRVPLEPSVTQLSVNSGTQDVKIELFDGIQLNANFPGAEIFGRLDQVMQKVSDALDPAKNPNHENIQSLLGGVVDPSGKNKKDDLSVLQGIVLDARADVGARQNRLELMIHRLDIQEINVTKQMSNNEDTDYAKAITEMTSAEAIHQASLSVGAKIIQQTLVDFIR